MRKGILAGVAVLFLCLVAAGQRREAALKQAIDQAMSGRQGSVVVMDVASGRILASHRQDVAARRLATPGSAIKPFILLALIEAGVVRPSTSVVCGKDTRIAGRDLSCSHPEVTEPLDAVAALAYSCNSFFIQLAQRLPVGGFAEPLRQMGLTSPAGVAGEVVGTVRAPSSVEAHQLMAVGESGVEVTPLGVASAYRRIALRVRNNDSAMKIVLDGMLAAVRFGTARLAAVDGLPVAGKTGTSPAPDRLRTYAWFAGFAPAQQPEIVVTVLLEQGSGGADAAPVAQKIFAAYR